jgi:EmrB/QacA subfamily drug resistance transporter
VVATLASFLTPFMGSATNVALPAIGREMRLDAVALSWVATTYLLSAAVFLVPFGKLADIHGRKRVFVGGLLVYTVTSALCAVAPSFPFLLAGRVAQGMGGGMIFGTGVALLTSIIPPGRRGLALGVNVAAVYLGLSLGPPLGGLLTQQLGWRSVFLANVVLGAVATALAARGLAGEWRESPGERIDAPGAILYGLGLSGLMYGLSRLPSAEGAAIVALGLLALAAFVIWERRAAHPLLDMALFARNRVFAFSNLAALVNYAATFAVGFLLSLYFQSVRGLGAQAAGSLLAAQPLVQTAVSPLRAVSPTGWTPGSWPRGAWARSPSASPSWRSSAPQRPPPTWSPASSSSGRGSASSPRPTRTPSWAASRSAPTELPRPPSPPCASWARC